MDGNGIQKAWDDGEGSLDYYDRAWEWEAYTKQTTAMIAVLTTTNIRIRNLVVEDISPEDREATMMQRWTAFIAGREMPGVNCARRLAVHE